MSEPRELVLLSHAAKAIAEARTIDEVQELRDKAAAVRVYAKKAKLGRKIVNEAAAIMLRAQRRLGEMLQTINLADSSPGNQYTGRVELIDGNEAPVLLRDLGISKSESSRSQRIATLTDEVFEHYIAENVQADREPTVAGLLRLERQSPPASQSPPYCLHAGNTVTCLNTLIQAGVRFATVYAAPPWPSETQANHAPAGCDEGSSTIEEICAEPVAKLCEDDAHLHLWTTNASLEDALVVIAAWGFTYRSCFVWVRPQLGSGNYWRVSHELLLLGIRGSLPFADKTQRSWLECECKAFKRKPEAVRRLIERVSPGPYLEMYRLEPLTNPLWTVYSNPALQALEK